MANNVKFSTGLQDDLLKRNSDNSYVHKIENGHVYFATRENDEGETIGSIFYDVNGKRVSMGGGVAEQAKADDMKQNIADTYVTRISSEGAKYASTDGVTLTTYNGRNAVLDTILLPVAGTDRAGVVIAGAQTFAGNKTFTGIIHLTNTRDAESGSDSGVLIIGNKDGSHLIFDDNEIMAKNKTNGTSVLYLNADGGAVYTGGNFIPNGTTKTLSIGSATAYWKEAYIGNVVTDTLSGHLTGSLTGNVTGNVTGHASLDLPLAGGTMTGDISFATIASWPAASGETYPIKSKGLKWSGSSDNASIYYVVEASDKGALYLDMGDDAGTAIKFAMGGAAHTVFESNGNIYPATTNKGSLGTSDNKFASVYATNFYGIIDKAYGDESGNNIQASYGAKLQAHTHDGSGWSFRLLNKNGGALADTLTVPEASDTLAGLMTVNAQTFAGKKTFTGQVVVTGGSDTSKGTANSGQLIVGDPAAEHLAIDGNEIMAKASGTTVRALLFQLDGGDTKFGGNVNPYATNVHSLGTEDLAWKEAHIGEIYGHLNGSVTGTLSGNASSASKWLTGRTLTIGSKGKVVDGTADVSWSRAEIGISRNFTSFKTASANTDGWYTIATIADSTTSPAIFLVRGYAHSSIVFTVTKGYSTDGSVNILDYNASRNDGYAYVKGARLLKDGKVQIQIHTKTTAGATTAVNMHVNAFNSSDTLTLSDSLVADDSASPEVIQTREPAATGVMMANRFYGALYGTADKATNDTSGAAILDKYITRVDFAQADTSDSDKTQKLNIRLYDGNNALKATVQVPNASTTTAGVVNTGTQSFAGNKTFTGRIHFSNTTDAAKASDSGVITIGDKSGEHMLLDNNEIMVKNGASNASVFHIQAEGGSTEIGGNFIPKGNKSLNLGGESNYWKNAYISNVVTDTLSGHLTGSLTGPVTGNVTGNLTGNVTGNVTGHASEDLALKDLNTYVVTKTKLGDTADYERCVIALCETTAANTACSSHWKGSIYRTRTNGLVPMYVAEVAFQGAYSGASQAVYSLFSNFENTNTSANAGEGFRPCIFTYSGKTYAGVEFAQTQAAEFYITGNGNFKPFMVRYYNTSSSAILNAEINGSVKYGASVGTRQEYYLVGTTTKAIGDESGNNIKASYLAAIQQVTSDKDTFTFRGYNKNNEAMNNLITIPGATASGTDNTKWKAGLVTSQAQQWAGTKTFRDNIVISHPTTGTVAPGATNPHIRFEEYEGVQPVYLMYTDHDTYRSPAGLKVVGDSSKSSSKAWFEIEGDLIVGTKSTLGGDLTISGNIMPSKDITYTLGDNNYKWLEMHTKYGYIFETLYVNRSADGTKGGIALYSTATPTAYGIAMRTTSNQGVHGYVTSDWATYFSMDGANTRGWIFKQAGTNVASINGQGYAHLNRLCLNRKENVANGRIGWYNKDFYTWYDYMSNSEAGTAPTGGQPSQMGSVTTWARRSLIENVTNYGWIWESTNNAAAGSTSTQPTPRMALASDTGRLYLSNDLMIMMGDTDKFVHYLYANGAGATNYVGASWRAGVLGSGSANTNYYVIQSGTSSTANTTWENAVRIGQNNYDFTVGTTTKGGIGVANTANNTGNGISLYGGAMPNSDGTAKSGKPTYGLFFGGTATFSKHGYVQGDWATYFTMDSTANRGWVFLKGDTAVASINNDGKAQFNETYITGPLKIGNNANGDTNYIAFYGTTGDNPGSFNHAYIGENLYSSTECSELVIYKGNDIAPTAAASSPGPDRIRHIAAAHLFQIYKSALSGDWATICDSTVPVNVFEINQSGVVVTGNSTISGNTSIGGALTVTGATTLESTLDVLGITKLKQGSAATSTTTGALQVTGGIATTSTSFFGNTIIMPNPMQMLRWTFSTTDNNTTGCSWYGIGTYTNSDSYNWLNISNYWGINITTRGHAYLLHNGNVLANTGNASGTVGSGVKPVYVSGGVLTASASTIGSDTQLMYLNAGTLTASVGTIGNGDRPVYLSGGTITQCNTALTDYIRKDGSNYFVQLTDGSGANATGYRLVGSLTLGTWTNCRQVWAISSRHSGNGILTIAFGNNSSNTASTSTSYWQINYYGNTDCGSIISEDSFTMYMNGSTVYLFWKYNDYGPMNITCVNASQNRGFTPANGAWMTSIDAATYGTRVATTTINPSNFGTLDGRYIKRAGDTMSGALNFANGTWNKVGDDAQMGDVNVAGAFGIQGLNGDTNLRMVQYGGTAAGSITWNGTYFIFSNTIQGTLSGNASSASKLNILRSIGGSNHAEALKAEFNSYKSSIPRNCLSTYYSTAYSNGSFYMGYFLSGYDSTPYGGFFVAHYNTPYYVGISSGSFVQSQLWKKGDAVTGAVWNDYAECRESKVQEAGYVLCETGKDDLVKTIERLQHFAGVSSDTWGFSQGETEKAKTPIAVAGRVLVYPYQDRNNYKPGDCVCAAPGGKVDIMTREEIINYPDRIVGTVSCVPEYDTWGGGENADRDPVQVNGRIWIKVR